MIRSNIVVLGVVWFKIAVLAIAGSADAQTTVAPPLLTNLTDSDSAPDSTIEPNGNQQSPQRRKNALASVSTAALLPDGKLELKKLFQDSAIDSKFQFANQPDVVAFKKLMVQTLTSEIVLPSVIAQWKEIGWELRSIAHSKASVLIELPNQRLGRGVYLIRRGSKSKLAMQAPHRFYDKKTGVIARKLFEEHDVWAVGSNTANRKKIDLAHSDRHYFNAFTEALVEAQSDVAIVQLHGFSSDNKPIEGKSINVIISDTTQFPGRMARETATEFKTRFGKSHTRLFPLEVRWLGGTKNRQGNLVRQMGSVRFLHIEMNLEFRQHLVTDASVREQFIQAIEVGSGH